MLINGTLYNVETWYNLTKNEIKELESIDIMFLSKLLELPKTSPIEAYYLELGIIPIGVLIKARRINYLHEILMREKGSMLHNFFLTQWFNPTRGDWTEMSSSLEYLRGISKTSFKNIVKNKAKHYALRKLKEQQMTHSKMNKKEYKELKIQKYFLSSQFDTNAE